MKKMNSPAAATPSTSESDSDSDTAGPSTVSTAARGSASAGSRRKAAKNAAAHVPTPRGVPHLLAGGNRAAEKKAMRHLHKAAKLCQEHQLTVFAAIVPKYASEANKLVTFAPAATFWQHAGVREGLEHLRGQEATVASAAAAETGAKQLRGSPH